MTAIARNVIRNSVKCGCAARYERSNALSFDRAGSLGSTLHHLATFWEARERPNVVLLRYEELKADLGGRMRFLADRLPIRVPEDRWPELVDAATFDRMRERADEVAPGSAKAIWHDNRQFFHRGTTGQWRNLLGPADLERYDRRVAELASPDLAAWVHGGVH